MEKRKKITHKILLAALICTAVGAVFLLIGMILGGNPGIYIDQTGIHSVNEILKRDGEEGGYQTLEKKKLDKFSTISMNVDYGDIQILLSDDEHCYLEYCLSENKSDISYQVKDNTFTFKSKMGLNGGRMYITSFDFSGLWRKDITKKTEIVKLYIPRDAEFQNIKLVSECGDISLQDLTAEGMELQVDYGDINIDEFHCKDSRFILESGDVSIESADLGDCQIESDYGNVELNLTQKVEAYSYDLETDYGEIKIPGVSISGQDGQNYRSTGGDEGKIKVSCDSGDIVIDKK